MKASIRGRLAKLKNISSFKEPLLEAVANSFQSLAVSKVQDPQVEVRVFWEPNPRFAGKAKNKPYHVIRRIEVQDNGEGFTKENFESFETMDSDLKTRDFGCKGIGRFLWLKAFDAVHVKSVYCGKSGEKRCRSFTFTVNDISEAKDCIVDDDRPCLTTVILEGLHEGMQKKSEVSLEDIVDTIVRHFLLDFVNGTAPQITVIGDGESLSVNDAFNELNSSSPIRESFCLENFPEYKFDLIQQRLTVNAKKGLSSGIYYCAGGRVVCKAKTILDAKFESITNDSQGNDLLYIGLLKSTLFNELVNNERNFIDFVSVADLGAYPEEKVILENVARLCQKYLKPEFDCLDQESKVALRRFADDEAPEYKGFLNKHASELYVKPNSSTAEIRDYLSAKYFQYEKDQRKKINQLIDVEWTGDNVEDKIKEIENRVDPIAAHDLVKFAATRRFYLSMYKKAISLNDDGKYQKERIIHSLIFPMNSDTETDLGMDKHNLWLIDDRLTFVNYLTSDQSFSVIPITSSQSLQRMDLAALKLYSMGPSERVGELYIIEFKRPGREDYDTDENPISQVLDYVEELRAGKIKAADGTEISNAKEVPIFCFVVAQLTPKLRKQCRNSSLQMGATGDFYFGVIDKVYFEVYNLNSLYLKAKERNHALLRAAKLDDI